MVWNSTPKMSSSHVPPEPTFCEACSIHLTPDNYKAHIMGKKHKSQLARCSTKSNIEETGLIVKGVPPHVNAAEVAAAFGRYGLIAKVEIYENITFVNFTERSSCDEALKHQHFVRNTALHVERRKLKDHNNLQRVQNKRGFDNTMKNSTQTQKKVEKATNNGEKKPAIVLEVVLKALKQPAPVSEQMTTLQQIILAEPNHSSSVCNKIHTDVMNALSTNMAFSVRELFAFGSMTTGLAFKDSDLDLYAHLELNSQTHLLTASAQQHQKKVFGIVKSCLYRKPHIFKDIVPIQGAKVPLIKFVHRETKVACDLSFRDKIGYYNSNLLRHYLSMNDKFFELMVFLKYWARVHDFVSTSKLSSFSLSMLCLSFLLSLKNDVDERIVPTVDELLNKGQPSDGDTYVNHWKCSFDSTPIKVTLPDQPQYSLLGLLKGFFEYIATLPFQTDVLSVLTGELIPRKLFDSPEELPNAYTCYKHFILKHPEEVLVQPQHCAVIHDPFRLNHNLLARVNLVTMQGFVQACKKGAEDCAVAISNEQLEFTLLHHLLRWYHSPVLKQVPSQSKNMGPTLLILDNRFTGSENPYDNMYKLIYVIFEKILFLKVSKLEVETKNESDCKVSKTDTMKDVHENSLTHNMLTCEGYKDVWNGRKKAKCQLNLDNPLSFDDEVKVSKLLAQKKQNVHHVPVSFQCKLLQKGEKYHLIFDPYENKRTFKGFWMQIEQLLPKWMISLKQTLNKTTHE